METTQRQSYLDWLRIFSIAGVLFFHSAMPYAAHLGWHIKNQETSTLLFLSNIGMHLVRMPLLFFISGTVSYYMMQRRSAFSFIGLRFTRLLIPLLAGMLLIVPPQIYMERLTQGYTGTYLDFYKTVFQFKMYPKGNFSWHHLWFIAYLFIYDLVFAPVFMYMISDKSRRLKQAIGKLGNNKLVFLLAVPSVLWFTFICQGREQMPDLLHDGAGFVYWLLFVLAGFICILVPSLMESLQRNRRISIAVGFAGMVLFYYFVLNSNGNDAANISENPGLLFRIALKPIIAWAWVFGLIGYGKKYLNRPHKSLHYLNQAVYPFYILHQTVIVVLVYYITQFNTDTVITKYIYTVFITFFISMALFHFFIKPYPAIRFLFGMKPSATLKKEVKKQIAGVAEDKKLTQSIA